MWKPETAEGREKEVSDATFQLDTIDVFLGKLGGHENSDLGSEVRKVFRTSTTKVKFGI